MLTCLDSLCFLMSTPLAKSYCPSFPPKEPSNAKTLHVCPARSTCTSTSGMSRMKNGLIAPHHRNRTSTAAARSPLSCGEGIYIQQQRRSYVVRIDNRQITSNNSTITKTAFSSAFCKAFQSHHRGPLSVLSKAMEDSAEGGHPTTTTSMLWFEGVATPMFAVTEQGIVLGWNRSLAALSGIASADIQQRAFSLWIEGDTSAWNETFRRALERSEGATTTYCEIALRSSSDDNYFSKQQERSRIFEIQISSNISATGAVIGAVCFVSEREQKRPAQINGSHHESLLNGVKRVAVEDNFSEGLRHLLEKCETPLFGVDPSGRVNFWNDKMAETVGCSRSEALREHFLETYCDLPYREGLQTVFDNAMQDQGTACFEMQLRCKAGLLRRLLATASPWKNSENGSPAGVFVVAHDITDYLKQERAMAILGKELELMVEEANIPIFGTNMDG